MDKKIRTIIIDLPEEINKSAKIKRVDAPWTNYPFRKADKKWLKHADIELFQQLFQTLLVEIQVFECLIEEEITFKVTSLIDHFYLLYVFGDTVLHYNNTDNPKIEINTNHSTAGYCPKGEFLVTLKPGDYTIEYISPTLQWLLESDGDFENLKTLMDMLKTQYTEHEILPPGLISEVEEELLLELRTGRYKSIMSLSTLINGVIEKLLYRSHQRIENAKQNIHPKERTLLERIRKEIRDEIDHCNNPSISQILSKHKEKPWDISRKHKQLYKQSLQEYSTNTRLEKAHTIILAGEDLTKVSYELSFSTYKLFSSQFKKHIGFCPREAIARQKEKEEQERLQQDQLKREREEKRNRKK